MSLGKRTRPMRRTTSISGIAFDLDIGVQPLPSYSPNTRGSIDGWDQRFLAKVASPRVHRRHLWQFANTAHFLHTCCLCKRSLIPGRDIYMYRGDSAFCSPECRQQQINLDEWKEKCSLASKKEASSSTAATGSSEGETVTAV